MSALVDEGRLLLALADPHLPVNSRRVLAVLAEPDAPATLDGLVGICKARWGIGRRWVFYTVGLIEERGWLPIGVIR